MTEGLYYSTIFICNSQPSAFVNFTSTSFNIRWYQDKAPRSQLSPTTPRLSPKPRRMWRKSPTALEAWRRLESRRRTGYTALEARRGGPGKSTGRGSGTHRRWGLPETNIPHRTLQSRRPTHLWRQSSWGWGTPHTNNWKSPPGRPANTRSGGCDTGSRWATSSSRA